MAADMSVIDMLLDRIDPSSNMDIKMEPDSRMDLLDMQLKDLDTEWPELAFLNNMDLLQDNPLMDTFDGILNGGDDVMYNADDAMGTCSTSSAASDSGLSSLDQQLSPVPPGLSPLPPSDGASDSECSIDLATVQDVQPQEKPVMNKQIISSASSSPRVRRIIRMTPLTSPTTTNNVKAHSLLLPVSALKGASSSTGVRTIRIINATPGTRLPGLRMVCNKPSVQMTAPVQAPTLSSTTERTSSVCESEDSDCSQQYPSLELSAEERRLLKKEGIALPSHYPLTKLEERELKRIRRKIRNKISAQDSRKRKKEYVDGLEDRVRRCTDENAALHKRVKMLQSQNTTLNNQVRRLQAMLAQNPGGRQVQNSTCVMVLLLSLALVLVPNMRPGQNNSSSGTALEDKTTVSDLSNAADKLHPVAGRSRTLLYKYPVCNEELPFNVEGDDVDEELCTIQDHDYEPPTKMGRMEPAYEASKRAKSPLHGLDMLDVDDVWPPPKAPPDVAPRPSVDGHWQLQAHLAGKLDAMIDEVKPNSTDEHQETRTVLLNISE